MQKTPLVAEIIGWYGAVAIISAYFLNSFSFIASTSSVYQSLNITGAIGIVVVSYFKRAYQPMALNLIWTVIGVVAIARLFVEI